MNGLQCNVTEIDLHRSSGQTTDSADPDFQKPLLVPGNGTSGSKQPFYWFQNKSNNIFEGIFAPLSYLDLYNFLNGVQGDIFEDPCITIPAPGPNQTVLPLLNRAVAIPGQVLKFTNAALVNVTGLTIASAPGAGSIAPSIPSAPPASLISSAVSQPLTTYTIATPTTPPLDTDYSSSLTPTGSTSIVGVSPTSTMFPPSALPPLILNPRDGLLNDSFSMLAANAGQQNNLLLTLATNAGQQLDAIQPDSGLVVRATPDPPSGAGRNQGAASSR